MVLRMYLAACKTLANASITVLRLQPAALRGTLALGLVNTTHSTSTHSLLPAGSCGGYSISKGKNTKTAAHKTARQRKNKACNRDLRASAAPHINMDGVTALQKHLVRVKLEHAEREAALERTVAELKGENDELKAALDDAADELDLCWAHVHQLRLETTTKFQVEERDDWRALVRSVQEDRQRLQQENARLQALVAPGPAARTTSAPLPDALTSPRPPRPTRPPPPPPVETPRLAKKPRERAPSPRATAYALTGTPRKRKIVLPRPGPSAREPWFLWVLLFGRPLDIDGPVLAVCVRFET